MFSVRMSWLQCCVIVALARSTAGFSETGAPGGTVSVSGALQLLQVDQTAQASGVVLDNTGAETDDTDDDTSSKADLGMDNTMFRVMLVVYSGLLFLAFLTYYMWYQPKLVLPKQFGETSPLV
uniref:Uncharacterized protein n=1 Tax=Noctiluca scintillans TaxID=2966 RepID=A0A7S0ZY68_NOCSC